ncbi:MAG: nucleotidyltransferase domain-containing protein, partial [Desulfobacterales bacterium]|nr:nucleotidyltransferase domain-containing protein [Desulfobacterales bacterium]
MIRDGIKLQDDVLERLPGLIQALKQHSEVVALYSFGGAAKNELKPLSDLDYAILLSGQLSKRQRFEKHLELIGIFNNVFRTD